jgi:glyoxylate/hydroxypyruvate reductase
VNPKGRPEGESAPQRDSAEGSPMNRAVDAVLAVSTQPERWEAAFRQAMPRARLHRWPDVPSSADYAFVWKPPEALFTRCRIRRAIFNLGAGVDALMAVSTLPTNVPVVRLEDAGMSIQMAEYVTLAVLRAFREQDAYAQAQREARWVQRRRLDKPTFCIGLLGVGVLGRAVAKALRALDFPVLGWSRSPGTIDDVPVVAGDGGLREVLGKARVLVVLLPDTPRTRGMLDRPTLSQLPQGAHVVNIARGPLIVENDLLALLDEGHLASATLDVFDEEPLPPGHRFWHHPRIVITPHVSAATLVDVSVAQVVEKLDAIERGEAASGVVDMQRGY